MKRIKSTVSYTVPNWNFCNSDILTATGDITKQTCRFCIKDKSGVHCTLYDKSLATKDDLIYKVRECCKATAGFESVIDPPQQAPTPVISPKELMKQTLTMYKSLVNDLVAQGYPRSMAEQAAEKSMLK